MISHSQKDTKNGWKTGLGDVECVWSDMKSLSKKKTSGIFIFEFASRNVFGMICVKCHKFSNRKYLKLDETFMFTPKSEPHFIQSPLNSKISTNLWILVSLGD